MNTAPYSILVGVGTLYIAPANHTMPALSADPSGYWRALGETDGGVKVNKTQKIEKHTADQRTGAMKATRSEESLMVETNLQELTLENLADVINATVTDTAAGAGTIGKRSMPLHAGETVAEYAFLYRGESPYGGYPAQFYVPRGFFTGDAAMAFTKGKKTLIPVKIEALEDLNASTEGERFGVYEAQDAAAL